MSLNQSFEIHGQVVSGTLRLSEGKVYYSSEGQSIEYRFEVTDRSKSGIRLRIFFEENGIERSETVFISKDGDQIQLRRAKATLYGRILTSGRTVAEEERHELYSPMPGFIRRIFVAEGDEVKKGDRLAIIEAMKMEHTLTAPFSGKVERIFFAEGDRVGRDEIIVKIG
jgi:biotin carboxyl carrier protein